MAHLTARAMLLLALACTTQAFEPAGSHINHVFLRLAAPAQVMLLRLLRLSRFARGQMACEDERVMLPISMHTRH